MVHHMYRLAPAVPRSVNPVKIIVVAWYIGIYINTYRIRRTYILYIHIRIRIRIPIGGVVVSVTHD